MNYGICTKDSAQLPLVVTLKNDDQVDHNSQCTKGNDFFAVVSTLIKATCSVVAKTGGPTFIQMHHPYWIQDVYVSYNNHLRKMPSQYAHMYTWYR